MLYHVALADEWRAAVAAGAYLRSTRGRSLAEQGYVHLATRAQLAGVLARFYADCAEPLVLLVVDEARLRAPLRYEPVGAEHFPHLYGPLDVDAVVAVAPLARAADGGFVLPEAAPGTGSG
jgi:uncharacterized protein (DUF952 family)